MTMRRATRMERSPAGAQAAFRQAALGRAAVGPRASVLWRWELQRWARWQSVP